VSLWLCCYGDSTKSRILQLKAGYKSVCLLLFRQVIQSGRSNLFNCDPKQQAHLIVCVDKHISSLINITNVWTLCFCNINSFLCHRSMGLLHTCGSLGRYSDLWLKPDAWMSHSNKLPGLQVLFPVCVACFFCVMGSILCKWTARGLRKSHCAAFMFKCSSPSSGDLAAACRARGLLQSLISSSQDKCQVSGL